MSDRIALCKNEHPTELLLTQQRCLNGNRPKEGRCMKVKNLKPKLALFIFGFLSTILFTTGKAIGADFIVTSVIREVPLKQGEPPYKDFYINAGTNNGLKNGVYIDAKRKMNAYDNLNNRMIGDTPVKVARLKLIHVDKGLSIARLVKFYEKDKTPIAGFDSVMIGDLIEVSTEQ